MWNNEITRQLGIKLPFVGAGMAIVGSPELTAAVSNAGGVGLFCLGPGAPEMLGDGIDSIRRLSSAPFGVDFIVEETGFGPATTEAHVEVAIAKHVPLAVFFWNAPEERWIRKLKRAGDQSMGNGLLGRERAAAEGARCRRGYCSVAGSRRARQVRSRRDFACTCGGRCAGPNAGYRGRWNRGWPDSRGGVHARRPGRLRRHPAACERREPRERRVQGAPRARARG